MVDAQPARIGLQGVLINMHRNPLDVMLHTKRASELLGLRELP